MNVTREANAPLIHPGPGPVGGLIDRALDLVVIVTRGGGSTVLAERVFRNILHGSGEAQIGAVWRLDMVAAYGVVEGRPLTVIHPIDDIGVNLVRVSGAVVLSERFARGEVSAPALAAEIERVRTLRPPYGRWAGIGAAAAAAGAFTRICGGDWGAFGLAFVAAGLGQVLRSWLQAAGRPVAPVTLACGVLSATLAALGLRLGWSAAAAPALVGSIVYMVPGVPLIIGFMDALSHRHLVLGLERIANALFLFLILAVAIAFAWAVVM
jgi:uncharacterized membrane protein YjjP (DUF1212 family)